MTLLVSSATSRRRVQRLGALILLSATVAVAGHHVASGEAMAGLAATSATCVAVAAHAASSLDAPVAPVPLAFFGLTTLIGLAPLLRAPRRERRARAGPHEWRLPLRC